jgi:type III secretion system low calcium response chaperone LcrH/SycD
MVAVARAMLSGEVLLRDICSFEEKHFDTLYAMGHAEFQRGRYAEARRWMQMLVLLDPLQETYWLAFGTCLQALGELEQAAQAYGMSAYLDVDNPIAHLRAAECFHAMAKDDLALHAVRACLGAAAAKPEFADITERATALQQSIGN